jgi:hypothetical protein
MPVVLIDGQHWFWDWRIPGNSYPTGTHYIRNRPHFYTTILVVRDRMKKKYFFCYVSPLTKDKEGGKEPTQCPRQATVPNPPTAPPTNPPTAMMWGNNQLCTIPYNRLRSRSLGMTFVMSIFFILRPENFGLGTGIPVQFRIRSPFACLKTLTNNNFSVFFLKNSTLCIVINYRIKTTLLRIRRLD